MIVYTGRPGHRCAPGCCRSEYRSEGAHSIEHAKRGGGGARNRESEYGAISQISLKADPQRGPFTDVNLPRGLRGSGVS